MNHPVTLIDISDQTILCIRKRGHYRIISEILPEIALYAIAHGIPLTGPPVFVCHEASYEEAQRADDEGNADIEVGFPIAEGMKPGPGMTITTLPGGRFARVLHQGPYDACENAYTALFRWIAENGLQVTGHIREVYLNDPHEVAPEEIQTEILAPVG